MLKIILYIIILLIILTLIVVGYANGLIRGLKIMSIKNFPTLEIEKKLIAKIFKDDPNVDPFFYSLYIKQEMKRQLDAKKKEIVKSKTKSKAKPKVKSKAKKNVKKTK